MTRDPSDDYVVALARESSADVLVSGDKDLLETHELDIEGISPRGFVERLDEGTSFPTD